jgi:multidrug efflux system outer membrane protein
LIAQALGNNRDLRSAALHVAEARAAFRIQRSAEWPTLGADAIGIRTLVPAGTLTGEPLLLSEYEVGISELSWELDFWGRVRNLKGSALESYLATDAARRGAAVSLVAQVAIDYLGLRELDERLMLARQTAASREESFRIFKRRFQVGSTSKLDLTQVETLLTQAQGLSAQLEQQRAAQAHGLTLLIGAAADLAPAEGGFDDQSVLSELGAGVPSELLTSRPDIVAAEHQLKAAHANIGAARAAFFPRVTLTGAFGSASADLDGLFGAGSRSWTFLPSISLPIFDSGRNRANLDLAKVRGDLAVANYEQVRIQQTMLAAQTERARLAKLRYDNGAAAFLEVLDAQRDLLSVEQQLVQTRCALLSSRVSLYAALGGGSMEFVATPPSHTP